MTNVLNDVLVQRGLKVLESSRTRYTNALGKTIGIDPPLDLAGTVYTALIQAAARYDQETDRLTRSTSYITDIKKDI